MSTKCLVSCFFFFQSLLILGQTPEKISYQATIVNADNTLLSKTRIAMKIAILQNSLSGTSVYEEVHSPVTSSNGTVSLEIGGGSPIRGSFSEIVWSKGPYFIETSVDINGGSSYKLQGASQLLSVPYALHAKTAERIADDGNYVLKAKPISFTTSRNANTEDVGNIIECTADATLTIINNFVDMKIGDVINIEAHNGAKLIVETADQVELNYAKNGNAIFESTLENVRFGLLRKIDVNAYIISGQ
ncbi:hypothetical protein [Pricia sp.]|uniref:hypothetical protein n=1 Tax=Pricia sp. TaxID=2268138 RepID=UPI0035930BFD